MQLFDRSQNSFGLTTIYLFAILLAGVLVTGCGKKEGVAESNVGATPWHKVDTPPGADPSVPDSLGGKGFENIAEALGFSTYVMTDEDKKLLDFEVHKGGQITTSTSRFPLSFRPFFFGPQANFTENSYISSLCFENLIGVHPVTLEFVPSLASHWKISEDKMTFTFRIDPNARFSDGKPVTAQDVVETFRLVMDESLQSPSMRISYERYETPVALSKYLVSVTCKEQNWRNLLTFGAGLGILQADQIKGMTGREFVDKFQFDVPIGSGPYIILNEDVKKQESYKFTRRSDYWAIDKPMNVKSYNFDKLAFNIVKDNPTIEYEKYKLGESDYLWFTSRTTEKWVADTTYEALQNNWVHKYRIFTKGPAGTYGYFYNLRKAPFNDIRVRKAFAMLLDRTSIINKILLNEYEPLYSFYGNSMYESPNCPKVTYDPKQASSLLAEAGWKTRNSDGFLTKNGKPFVVELGIIKPLETFVTPYKETLREAGIDLRIKFVDGNTLSQNMMERNFSLAIGNYGGLTFPNPETSLSSKLADLNDNNNVWGFKNQRVDEIIKAYSTEFDQAKRVQMIRELDGIVNSEYIVAYWWSPKGVRLAVWDKFGMPPGILSTNTQVGDHDLAIMTGWWIDPKKEAALNDAKKNKKRLPGSSSVTVDSFWRDYGK